MNNGSKWPRSIQLELQSRQIILLFLGSAFFVFLIFIAGISFGKKISSRPQATAEELAKKHLDCLDWLDDYVRKKTSDEREPFSSPH